MDEAEELLKESLRERTGTPEVSSGCPSERELWAYLEGTLSGSQEEVVGQHVSGCEACLEALLLAQEVRPGIGFDPKEGVKEELIRKVKTLGGLKGPFRKKGPFHKNRWLFWALGFLTLSFFVPRYFLQCLLLAALFGAKWVFDSVTHRTLIVMHETLKKRRDKEEEMTRPPSGRP